MNQQTPASKQVVPRSRTGEEQPRVVLFFFIVLALGTMIAVILSVIIMASTNASKAVLEDEKDRGLYSQSIVQAHFSILSARYVDTENASCHIGSEFLRPATLTVRFKTILTPESCSIFINGRLISTERRLAADCGRTCAFTEYNRQFSLRQNDYRDDQLIRVCCEDICVERTLEKLCSQTKPR